MTTAALDIYQGHLDSQLGSGGVFTEPAVFDPSGAAVTIYGIFDKNKIRTNKGSGNVQQKKSGPRFIVSDIDFTIDIYENKTLYLSYRDETYIIDEIDRDDAGAQVIWLK